MKNKIVNVHPLNADVAALLFRLIFGGIFIYHGLSKLMAFEQIFPQFPDLIGIGGKTSFIMVIIAEFIGGLFVVLGLFTRIAVIPIFIVMVVAFFVAHANDAFSVKELACILLLFSIAIFINGSGRYSIDNVISKR